MTQKGLKRFSYAVLVGPGVLIYGSIAIFPILVSLVISVTQWSGFGVPKLVGLANYVAMFKDGVFLHALRNNALIVGISVFGQIPFGFILAYVLYRRMVKFENFFETMIFLPITISAIVVAILWNRVFSPIGIYTGLIRSITHNPQYIMMIFQSKVWAIFPVLFVILWMYTGLYMIIFLANLQKISRSVIEAAIIDGARESQILGRIILPSMTGVIFTTAVLAISGSLKSFDLVWAMTAGGPAHYTEVLAIYMYDNTFQYYKYGYGSAVSIVMVLLSVGLITIAQNIFGRYERKYT